MSLVIKKFEPGGKTSLPRLYKRGNDDIDLDAYIRDAESEFSFWLANSRLKDKEKQQVQEAYSKMLLGINDGTFTYKIGGGYNNSVGMSNKTKGFDAAGLAAGFLGDILRRLAIYEAPEEKLDTSKTKYEGAKTIGARGLNQLLGEAKNLLYFINQDPLVDGKRGHAVRIKMLLDYVNDIAAEGNWDKYFSGYSQALKDQWFKDYEKYGKNIDVNNNGILDENEYLGLSKLLGLNNIELLFYSGQIYEEQPKLGSSPVYSNEEEYLNANHSRTTKSNLPSIDLPDVNYPLDARYKLNEILYNLPQESLLKFILEGFNLDLNGQELNTASSITRGFNGIPSFSNLFIMRLAAEVLRRRDLLHQFDTNQNYYYIPFKSDVLDKDSTGIVYKINSDGRHLLLVMDRRDIPFFTNLWHNDFVALLPSNKNGGVLKAQLGTVMTRFLDYLKEGVTNTFDFANNPGNWDNAFNFDKIIGEINTGNIFSINGLNLVDTLNKLGSSTLDFSRNKSNTGYKDWNILYNTTGLNKFFGWDENKAEAKGMSTYNRSALLKLLASAYNSPDKLLKVGDSNIYYSDGKWQLANNPAVTARKAVVASTQSPDTVSEEELFGGSTEDSSTENLNSDFLNEKYLPNPDITNKSSTLGSFIGELAPGLIGAGRLWASLRTNNNVYKTILPSLKPVLKDTYERYSPVTGAFSAMQFKNRLGADVLRQSYKPFTSDASLAAARMLEGQRQANQLQAEGFLADDQEIRRTKAEALARSEDSMARRSDVANFNRASINQTNRERAQLKATRLKSNWQSWDNFLQGVESRLRTRLDENRTLSNQFREQIAMDNATRWYNRVMEDANRAKDEWIKSNTKDGVTPDITTWGNKGSLYMKYDRMRKLAEDMKTARLQRDMANIYGILYTSPYSDASYNNFIKWV